MPKLLSPAVEPRLGKKTDALRRTSLARRGSRFSRSSALTEKDQARGLVNINHRVRSRCAVHDLQLRSIVTLPAVVFRFELSYSVSQGTLERRMRSCRRRYTFAPTPAAPTRHHGLARMRKYSYGTSHWAWWVRRLNNGNTRLSKRCFRFLIRGQCTLIHVPRLARGVR
jgi:hypothetical protein